MADKPSALHTLALEINSHTIKGAQLTLRKGKPSLVRLFEIPFPSKGEGGSESLPSIFSGEAGQALLKATHKTLVVSLLNTNEVLVRQLEVKLKKESDIDAVLEFQAEPLLPYSVENAIVDRQVLVSTSDGTLLTILAARKDHLQQHLEFYKALGIDPEVISCTPVALAYFSHVFAQSATPQFLVHISHASTSCLLVKEGKLIAAQGIPQGIEQILAAYKKDVEKTGVELPLDTVDFSAVKKEANPFLAEAIEGLHLEITRTLYALSKQAKGQEVGQILVTGEAGKYKNLSAVLCQQLNKILVAPSPIPEFNLTAEQLERFAIPIGGAMSVLSGTQNEIDFRQKEFAYPNPWKRYKTPVFTYIGLCFILAIAIYFFGNAYLKNEEDGMRLQFSELLQSMNKPYNEFDHEYTSKMGGKLPLEEKEATPIQTLSEDDVLGRLRFIEKELKTIPESYPLLPNTPTVSDVFAWLATQPFVVGKDAKTGAKIPLLQIESFSYTLVKRPEVTKKQEKYQVKVELEFSSPTPKLAREFHDALIAPNNFVDPKGDVKWSTNRGLYRASFFLKDKTSYPSP